MSVPFLALLRRRPMIGVAPAALPLALFVPLGFVLGPARLNVLSVTMLAHMDAGVTVTLAALGVFVGLELGSHRIRPRIVLAGMVETGATLAVVALATAYLLSAWNMPLELRAWVVALALAIPAAASAAQPRDGVFEAAHHLASDVAYFDDVLPIVAGAWLVGALGTPYLNPLAICLLTAFVGAVVGVVGWLLLRFETAADRRLMFVVGTILLLGGGAAWLSLSPLLAGVFAGLFWSAVVEDRAIGEDLRRIQHPAVVLLLLAAGAEGVASLEGIWLFVVFLLFSLAGKIAGAWAASLVVHSVAPARLATHLISPGVVGIALALNVQQVAPGQTTSALVFAVAFGFLAREALAILAMDEGGAA